MYLSTFFEVSKCLSSFQNHAPGLQKAFFPRFVQRIMIKCKIDLNYVRDYRCNYLKKFMFLKEKYEILIILKRSSKLVKNHQWKSGKIELTLKLTFYLFIHDKCMKKLKYQTLTAQRLLYQCLMIKEPKFGRPEKMSNLIQKIRIIFVQGNNVDHTGYVFLSKIQRYYSFSNIFKG